MTRKLVDAIDTKDMGVINDSAKSALSDYVRMTWGNEYDLGMDVEVEGREVVDSTGEVVGYIFLMEWDEES